MNYKGQEVMIKVNVLQQSVCSQQAVFITPHSDRQNVTQASFVVSEPLARKLKPNSEGELVKKCCCCGAAGIRNTIFLSVSLS